MARLPELAFARGPELPPALSQLSRAGPMAEHSTWTTPMCWLQGQSMAHILSPLDYRSHLVQPAHVSVACGPHPYLRQENSRGNKRAVL